MSQLVEKLRKQFSNRKILVVGLGLQGGGVGLAKFFAELDADVTVTDLKTEGELGESVSKLRPYNVDFSLGGHKKNDFLQADYIFKGPAVPWSLPEIVEAQSKGIPVEMETSFFASLCPSKIIGVTGTRGKTTVSFMIHEVLQEAGKKVFLGGNIPKTSTIEILKHATADDYVILELSSWALSGFHRKKLSPHIGVFTNFYPDHLNYYKNLDEYFYDKKALYLYQKTGDMLIANKNLEDRIKEDKIQSTLSVFTPNDFPSELKYIKGGHNLENAAAAFLTATAVGINPERALDTISSFRGIPYRQEKVKTIGTVIFINDTTSTTPVATIKAIDSFSETPIVLILGGNAKGLPYDDLLKKLNAVDKIVLLKGSFTDEIFPQLQKHYPDKLTAIQESLESAVKQAYTMAKEYKKAAVILFSPGATSFASFKNEFHRGEEFNRIVATIE